MKTWAYAFGRVLFIGALIFSSIAYGQRVQLTPEQQRLLNQLPPQQQQQAMQALRDAGSSNAPTSTSRVVEEDSRPVLVDIVPTEQEQVARRGSIVVINFSLSNGLSDVESARITRDAALSGLLGRNTYEVSDSGEILLPGVAQIPALGLDAVEIRDLLTAQPVLRGLDAGVRLLAPEPTGVAALEAFGYSIFGEQSAGLDGPSTGPVPPDYLLGPGDTVRVQYYGNINGVYEVDVTRDGVLNLPELGPVTGAGMTFEAFRADVAQRVRETLIGTQVSVTMGQLRSIRVFVVGDATRPGSYVVNSMATISSALYQAGGINSAGSLRDIQLKRDGRVVGRIDLYDLLLRGDTSGDLRLQPGDAIFVPPVGAQITISGAVRRPAIYETRNRETLADAIALAGGLLPEAYAAGAHLERIGGDARRVVLSVDVGGTGADETIVAAGDLLVVPRILERLQNSVTLSGHVYRPGPVEWRSGMRLSDILPTAMALKPGADTGYLLVRREDSRNRQVHVLSANLAAAIASPGTDADIRVEPRDTVHVFSLALGRQQVVAPLLEELRLQSSFDNPYQEVSVSGVVNSPGSYPLEPGMRVSDLIRAGGGLSEEAYTTRAELARYQVIGGERRDTDVVEIDLDAILRGDTTADVTLSEHDNLRISAVPDWDSAWQVSLEGEFRFPGTYRIRRGETLAEVVARAGGLSDQAFPEGAVFLRDDLRVREQEQMDVLARRLESELATMSLADGGGSDPQSMATGRELLAQLRNTDAVGRLVIELVEGGSGFNPIELRDGDRLLVPGRAQEVTVIGEAQQNTSHLYQPGLDRNDYIAMSGGLTRRADRRLIYVVRASGSVVTGNRSRWFGRGGSVEIRPGDTIVVPIDTDRMRPLTFWTNVTQILYQAAIAVAAVQTFDN